MSNSIALSPAVMITRIAQEQGASPNTQLAHVARLRMEMANAQADKAAAEQSSQQALVHPANGAEVDLLI